MGMEYKEVKISWSVAAEFSVMPGRRQGGSAAVPAA